jgi:hypothetical protein
LLLLEQLMDEGRREPFRVLVTVKDSDQKEENIVE